MVMNTLWMQKGIFRHFFLLAWKSHKHSTMDKIFMVCHSDTSKINLNGKKSEGMKAKGKKTYKNAVHNTPCGPAVRVLGLCNNIISACFSFFTILLSEIFCTKMCQRTMSRFKCALCTKILDYSNIRSVGWHLIFLILRFF